MNAILEANGYPELGVRIGIDIGVNAIDRYGLRSETIIATEKISDTNAIKSN